MQKLETRNGTLVFVEVLENFRYWQCKLISGTCWLVEEGHGWLSGKKYFIGNGVFESLGEVTKDGITFDCEPYLGLLDPIDKHKCFVQLMNVYGIELTEGNKFVVLKEKQNG